MATVVVMVWVTVWDVVSEPATREAAERRVTARRDLVCMVDGGWVDVILERCLVAGYIQVEKENRCTCRGLSDSSNGKCWMMKTEPQRRENKTVL